MAELPLSEWSYLKEGAGIRHLGPVAQDFYHAFGLGADDKSIATVDADGVALAAIQGLYQLIHKQEAQLREQAEKIQTLEKDREQQMARIVALEKQTARIAELERQSSHIARLLSRMEGTEFLAAAGRQQLTLEHERRKP